MKGKITKICIELKKQVINFPLARPYFVVLSRVVESTTKFCSDQRWSQNGHTFLFLKEGEINPQGTWIGVNITIYSSSFSSAELISGKIMLIISSQTCTWSLKLNTIIIMFFRFFLHAKKKYNFRCEEQFGKKKKSKFSLFWTMNITISYAVEKQCK